MAFAVMACVSGRSAAAEELSTSERVEQEMRTLTDEFNRAILSRDKLTLQRLLADDYRFGRETLVSKDNHIREIVTSTTLPDKQTVDTWDAQICGDTAIVTGLATATQNNTAAKDSYVVRFRWVNVWVKRNDHWQVVYNQSTPLSVAFGNSTEQGDEADSK
jgi:hypothetical protein